MRFDCRAVGPEYFESAPWRFVNQAELDAPPERAFAAFEDAESWPRWFAGIRRVDWTSPKPFGVGTTRTVTLSSATVFEHFFRWEPGRRFSFHLTAHRAPLPLFRALAEDYLLEPLDGGRTRFTYSVALEPALPVKLGGAVARGSFASMFAGAAAALPGYLRSAG
jgi:hypothetical protein